MIDVIWIRVTPRTASGAPVELRLAGGGQNLAYRHPVTGQQYRAGIVRRPRYSAQLGFDGSGWTGTTRPLTAAVSFATADPALRDQLHDLVWAGAAVTVESGPEGTVPAEELTGKVEDAQFAGAGINLTLVDASGDLAKPVCTGTFAGTGGIEGPEEAEGRVKRRTFGRVFNVEGRLLDVANSIYEFGDPAEGLASFQALRDKGREGPFDVLGWQGSIAATFAALQASEPQRGGGVVAPSIACAKWWTQPAGPLTADITGRPGTGNSQAVAALVDLVSGLGGGPSVADLAAAKALRPGVAGLHISGSTETFAQAIDRLLLGVSLLWMPRANGQIAILPWAFNENAEVLRGEFKGRARSWSPHKRRKVRYRRNERIHSDGEIAGILLEELRNGDETLTADDLLNSYQEWSDVQDSAGTRPEDNATVGMTVEEAAQVAEIEVDLIDHQQQIDTAKMQISDLFTTYGDTASAANSAAAALASKDAAAQHEANSLTAQTITEQARDTTLGYVGQVEEDLIEIDGFATTATNAATSAVSAKEDAEAAEAGAAQQYLLAAEANTQANAAASASSDSAATATAKATEAEQSAEAAETDRLAAQTARGGAESASSTAVSASEDAEGWATSAQAAKTLAVESRDKSNASIASTFPKVFDPALVGRNHAGSPLDFYPFDEQHPAYVAPDRSYIDAVNSIYNIWHRGLFPSQAGRTYRLHFDIEIISAGAQSGVNTAFYCYAFDEDGQPITPQGWYNQNGAAVTLAEGQRETLTWEHTLSSGYNAFADLRAGILTNRMPNSTALNNLAESRLHGFWVEDITESTDAAASANVASGAAAVATNAEASTLTYRNQTSDLRDEVDAKAAIVDQQATSVNSLASQVSSNVALTVSYRDETDQLRDEVVNLRNQVGSDAAITANERAIATAAASAAEAAKSLVAKMAKSSINPNANFLDWPTGQTLPTGWANWADSPTFARITNTDGSYAVSIQTESAADRGGIYCTPYAETLPEGPVVIEWDMQAVSGPANGWQGAGVLVYWYDRDNNNLGYTRFGCHATELPGGELPSWTGRYVYRWREPVQPPATASKYRIYAMTNYSGVGVSDDQMKRIAVYYAGIRPATDEEWQTRTVLPDLRAEVNVMQGAIQDGETARAYLETQVATHDFQISYHSTAISNQGASWGFTFNSNGQIVGATRADATATKSSLEFLYDKVSFVSASNTGNRTQYINGIWRIYSASGYMKLIGAGIGTSGQFIEWYGPQMAINQCSEANAISYAKANGDAYFGGSLSAGTLKNDAQSSATGTSSSVTVGPFGTNGNPIQVVTSYFVRSSYTNTYPATTAGRSDWDAAVAAFGGTVSGGDASGSKGVSCTVGVSTDRVVNGSTSVNWSTLSVNSGTDTISGVRPVPGDTAGFITVTRIVSGSVTKTDNAGGTGDRTFITTLDTRSNATFANVEEQRVGLIATEE